MAKKKSKKKDEKKKVKKKKLLKLKLRKKKDSNKKRSAKEKKAGRKKSKIMDARKKKSMMVKSERRKSGKNESKKEKSAMEAVQEEPTIVEAPSLSTQGTEESENTEQIQKVEPSVVNEADKSLHYNVQDAVKKLKEFKSMEDVLAFTKGDTRLTINRAVSALQSSFDAI